MERLGLSNRGGEFSCSSRSGGSGVRVSARPVIFESRSSLARTVGSRFSFLSNGYPRVTRRSIQTRSLRHTVINLMIVTTRDYSDIHPALQARSKSVSLVYSLLFILEL